MKAILSVTIPCWKGCISCCAECPNDTERITKNTKNLEALWEGNMYIQQQQRTYERTRHFKKSMMTVLIKLPMTSG